MPTTAGVIVEVRRAPTTQVVVVQWQVLDKNMEHQEIPSIDAEPLNLNEGPVAASTDRVGHHPQEPHTPRTSVTSPFNCCQVRAAIIVVKKTFTDIVLQVCHDSIISGVARWVETDLLIVKDIRDAAVEDAILRDKKIQHKRTIDNMEYALRTLGPIIEEAAQMNVTKKARTDGQV
jgi:hypothetical protein